MVDVPAVGEEIEPFVRYTDLGNWNRFAAVNDEFVPIHMDDEAGRAAGHPGAFGMGQLQIAYLHNLLRQWIGPDGTILAFSCQFRAINTKGQTLTARGRVVAVEVPPPPENATDDDAGIVVQLEVWTEDQHGTRLAPGTAKVALASRPGG